MILLPSNRNQDITHKFVAVLSTTLQKDKKKKEVGSYRRLGIVRKMSSRRGQPKHQNQYAWKPNAGRKINETEVGGRFRPLSEITGVCQRCKEQIDWKRRYGKYKPLSQPAKCQRCSKRAVRQAYHNLCPGCAKEQKVCAKCCCRVGHIIGRDSAEVEADQRTLEEAIKNARERDRRTLLREMNKGQSKTSKKTPSNEGNKVGDLFPTTSLEEYATKGRDVRGIINGNNENDRSEDEANDPEREEIEATDEDGNNNEDEYEGENSNEDEDKDTTGK